jgi:hypothetical protein
MRVEGVGAVDDRVTVRDEVRGECGRQSPVVCLDGHVRVQVGHERGGAVDLRAADIPFTVDHLPVEVAPLDGVVVDEHQRPNASGGEILDHGRAKPAGPDDEYARREQSRLPLGPDLVHDHLPGVPIQLCGVEPAVHTRYVCATRISGPSTGDMTELGRT